MFIFHFTSHFSLQRHKGRKDTGKMPVLHFRISAFPHSGFDSFDKLRAGKLTAGRTSHLA
jgi:hypothetical protein